MTSGNFASASFGGSGGFISASSGFLGGGATNFSGGRSTGFGVGCLYGVTSRICFSGIGGAISTTSYFTFIVSVKINGIKTSTVIRTM